MKTEEWFRVNFHVINSFLDQSIYLDPMGKNLQWTFLASYYFQVKLNDVAKVSLNKLYILANLFPTKPRNLQEQNV